MFGHSAGTALGLTRFPDSRARAPLGDLHLLATRGAASLQVRPYLRSAIIAERLRKNRVQPRPRAIVGQLLHRGAVVGPRGVMRKLLSRGTKVFAANLARQQTAENGPACRTSN